MIQKNKYIGTVVWFNSKPGYGFIKRDNEKDLFVHWSDIVSEGFKTLKKGQVVEFMIGENVRNEPKAIEVVILSDEEE